MGCLRTTSGDLKCQTHGKTYHQTDGLHKPDAGESAHTDEDKMNAWVSHYAKQFNVKFQGPSDELLGVFSNSAPPTPTNTPTPHPPPSVSTTLMMKFAKTAGPSGIVADVCIKNGVRSKCQ